MSDTHLSKNLQRARNGQWGAIFGFAVVGFYTTFTILSIARYPQNISPRNSYLSMLGNPDLSPEGALYYNLAVSLSGLAEVPFFIAISALYLRYRSKWLLIVGLLAGITNGLAVFMTGINPLHLTGDIGAHVTWSYIIFLSLIPVLAVFGWALWRLKGFSRYIGFYGFVVCAIDILFLITLLSGQIYSGFGSIMEWFSVFSYLIWIAFVSIHVMLSNS